MLQYVASVLRQFCRPVLERDKIIKSSAYRREFNFVPFGGTKGSDRIFSNENGKSLISKGRKVVDLKYNLVVHLSYVERVVFDTDQFLLNKKT